VAAKPEPENIPEAVIIDEPEILRIGQNINCF
jgi:hypothetical protein